MLTSETEGQVQDVFLKEYLKVNLTDPPGRKLIELPWAEAKRYAKTYHKASKDPEFPVFRQWAQKQTILDVALASVKPQVRDVLFYERFAKDFSDCHPDQSKRFTFSINDYATLEKSIKRTGFSSELKKFWLTNLEIVKMTFVPQVNISDPEPYLTHLSAFKISEKFHDLYQDHSSGLNVLKRRKFFKELKIMKQHALETKTLKFPAEFDADTSSLLLARTLTSSKFQSLSVKEVSEALDALNHSSHRKDFKELMFAYLNSCSDGSWFIGRTGKDTPMIHN